MVLKNFRQKIYQKSIELLFLIWSILFYFGYIPLGIKPSWYQSDFGLKLLRLYISGCGYIFRVFGLKEIILGRVPTESVLIASRHESMWETLSFNYFLDKPPAYVIKSEILKIPFWGRYIAKFGNISIDRDARGGSLLKIIKQAQKAIKCGRSIVIFPEATRMTLKQTTKLKLEGVYGCYKMLKIPLVAVALDSSRVWPKGSVPKQAGKITCKFAKPLAVGKSLKEVEKYLNKNMVIESINLHSKK